MSHDKWSVRIGALGACALLLFVISGLVLAIYTVGLQSGRSSAEADGYAAQYPADTQKRIENCLRGNFSAEATQCVGDAVTASHDAQRSEYDLKAQREMSEWAWWLLMVSLAQIPLSLAGLAVLIYTLRQGQEALKRAREANDIAANSQRPWIGIKAELLKFETFENRSLNLTFKIKFENVGKMVAEEFYADCKFIPMGRDLVDIMGAHFDRFPEKEQIYDKVVIPGDTYEWVGWNGNAIEFLPWNNKPAQRKDCYLVILAMCRYKVPGESRWRHSMQGFSVGENLAPIDDRTFRFLREFEGITTDKMIVRPIGRSRAT